MTGAGLRAAMLMLACFLSSEGVLAQPSDPLQVRSWAAACTAPCGRLAKVGDAATCCW